MTKFIISLFILLNLHQGAFAQNTTRILQDGEELCYKVRWQFFRLGTITIRTERSIQDSTHYAVSMLVESNPDLIFIKVKDINVALVHSATMMSKQFHAIHETTNERVEISHEYDDERRQAICMTTDLTTGKVLHADTLLNVPPYVEGPSLFFYTRWQSRSKSIITVPTIAAGKLSETVLDFTQGREYIELETSRQPVRTRKYKGVAGWQGATSAGLFGEFAGWISDDEAAIPIRAEMKVLLGSIYVELEHWNRPGWNPPVYVEVVKK